MLETGNFEGAECKIILHLLTCVAWLLYNVLLEMETYFLMACALLWSFHTHFDLLWFERLKYLKLLLHVVDQKFKQEPSLSHTSSRVLARANVSSLFQSLHQNKGLQNEVEM